MDDNHYIFNDYTQHWLQSIQEVQPLQATPYHHNPAYFGHEEERLMTELSVHQEYPVPQEYHVHQQIDMHQEQPKTCQEPAAHLQQAVYQELDVYREPLVIHQEPAVHQQYHIQEPPTSALVVQTPTKGKRGRPSKETKQGEVDDAKKAKRKMDRFNGMSVEEVMAKTLPDVLVYNLDILIVGINPGLMSAYIGHHYPNPGNHFWKCLFLSGLTDTQLNYMHDHTLPEKYGIGFTNMVERTTPGSKDLSSKEFREGGRLLVDKLQKYKPLIAAFNGKCIYEIFSKEVFGIKPKNLEFGVQPHKVPGADTLCFLMPSSSARCAQFPRAQDKVHFYIKLKELRDQLRGRSHSREVQETSYNFDLQLAKEDAKKMAIKEEQYDPGYDGVCRGHVGVEYQHSLAATETSHGPDVSAGQSTPYNTADH